MLALFNEGGPLFMGILTLEFFAAISIALIGLIRNAPQQLNYIKSIGLLAAITGILGQLIGLYSAFEYIEMAGAVSPSILASGLRVSSITSIYGLIIFVVCYLMWFGTDSWIKSRVPSAGAV